MGSLNDESPHTAHRLLFAVRQFRLFALVIATVLALLAAAAIGTSEADAQTVPGYSCTVISVGDDAIVSFAGTRSRSEDLRINGVWERTVTNDGRFLAEGHAGSTFQVRLRGPDYRRQGGFAEATCVPIGERSWSCTATALSANTARLSITGDRALSENLLIDGRWDSTITDTQPDIAATVDTPLEVRLRGNGYGSEFGWYPATCAWVEPPTPTPRPTATPTPPPTATPTPPPTATPTPPPTATPTPTPAPPATAFACRVTTQGADSIVTFSGTRAGSENLLADGRWIRTVTGLDSFRANDRAGQRFEVRLRGNGYSGNGVSFTTETCEDSETNLVWEDDFTGTSVDPTKWEIFEGNYGTPYRLQTYSQDNVRVENGSMFLEATYNADTDTYYSGMVYTNNADEPNNPQYASGNLGWTYGRFELRAKVPHGYGLWSALWMRPVDGVHEVDGSSRWPVNGEIDILEYIGPGRAAERPNAPINEIVHNIHYLGERDNGETVRLQHKGTWAPPGDPAAFVESFHVYALEWEPNEMRFYVDDVLWHTVSDWESVIGGSAPFDQPFDIIMNLQIGGWAGTPLPSDYPASMEIDWVRVYDLGN